MVTTVPEDDDPNDYEIQQDEALGVSPGVIQPGMRDMYAAWVWPEEYPNEPRPRLENWHSEDLETYCGGIYAKEDV